MSYREVLSLPIRAFWLLNANISRLLSEQDLRTLTNFSCAQSAEGAAKHREYLIQQTGEPVKLDPLEAKPEPDAFNTLRALAG